MSYIVTLNRYKRLLKEGFWVFLGQLLPAAGSLILVKVLSYHFEPAQYGRLALGLTVAGIINQVLIGGVVNGIGRYYSVAEETDDISAFLRGAYILMAYIAVAVIFIGLFLGAILFAYGHLDRMYIVLSAILFSLLAGFSSALSSIYNSARRRSIVAFYNALDYSLRVILVIAVVFIFEGGVASIISAYAMCSLLVVITQIFFLRKILTFPTEPDTVNYWIRTIWVYSWPFMVWGIFGWAQQASGLWGLKFFRSEVEVGQYSLLSQLSYSPIQLMMGVFLSFLSPVLYKRAGDATSLSRNRNVTLITDKISLLVISLGCLLSVVTFFFSADLVIFLASKKYLYSANYFYLLVLSGTFFFAAQVHATRCMSILKTATLIVPNIVISILGAILNFSGAYFWGVQGVVLASLIFSIGYFSIMFFINKS
jgi:O-antigen/teichoic acid export membrane protein